MPAAPLVLANASGNTFLRSFDGISYATFAPSGITNPTGLTQVGSALFSIDNLGAGAAQVKRSLDYGLTWSAFGPALSAGFAGSSWLFITPGGALIIMGTAQIFRALPTDPAYTTISLAGADNFFIVSMVSTPIGLVLTASDNTNGARAGQWQSTNDGVTWAVLLSTANTNANFSGQLITPNLYVNPFNALPWVMNCMVLAPFNSNQFNSGVNNAGPGAAQFPAPPRNGLGNGAVFALGTDQIYRGWDAGGNEFHATAAQLTSATVTAGPAAVANAPSLGVIKVKGDIFLGYNNALASFVLSQNHGTSWSSLGVTQGPGGPDMLVVGGIPQFPRRGSRQNPGESLPYGGTGRHSLWVQ